MTEATGWPDSLRMLTPETFDEFVDAHPVVLVDVWAEWCGPCRKLDPVMEGIADSYRGEVAVGKIDYDEHPELADDQRGLLGRLLVDAPGVTWGLPSLFVLVDGEVVERTTGMDLRDGAVVSTGDVEALLEPYL